MNYLRLALVIGIAPLLIRHVAWAADPGAPAAQSGADRRLIDSRPQSDLAAPVVHAAHLAADFELSGDLANAAWRHATPVRMESQSDNSVARPELSTPVRVLWSDNYLYIGYEAPYTRLTTFEPPRPDGKRWGLWERDVVEAFIGSKPGQTNYYSEYEIAPTGEKLDLLVQLPDKDFQWKSGFEAAVKLDSDRHVWRTEMRIPMRSLSKEGPRPGTLWRVNLYRCDRANNASLAWRPTLTKTFHTPARFGWLEFDN